MGTYYTWANKTKRQRLHTRVFCYDFKLLESCHRGSRVTNALCTLLASDWHGDVVAFLPDQSWYWHHVPEGDTRFDEFRHMGGDSPADYAEDWYTDISGVFKDAEGKTGWMADPPGPGGDWVEFPYAGPFDREVIVYRYIVNETKRVFYDREGAADGFDPLPILLGLSTGYLWVESDPHPEDLEPDGTWIGDVITPAHEPPDEAGYTDITGLYSL